MALNKKIKDELHALKGLDSSSVYDEEDQKKKKAAQAKANASKARDALKSATKSAPGAGLKNKAGSVTVNKSTRPTPRAQEKQENDNYLTRLRTELQGRLSDMRTNPRSIVDRYEDDESTRRRKELLIGSMLNSDKLLGVDTDGVYDARQTVQNMKGLSAQTANNARRAEGWKAEAEGFGNTALGNFYGSAKDTLDRLAGQLDAAATNIMSPVNRMKEAAKEEEFAGLLKYFTDRNWGTGARAATDDEISTGSGENQRQIAELEAKKNNGTITKDEQFLLDTLMKVQQKYDSGNVTVYDNDLDETAAGRLAAQDAYLQTRENVDYMGGQARAEGQQMRAEATVDSILSRMTDAGVTAEDYMMERDALYDEYMNAGAIKTFIGNRGRFKLLNYTPEQYAAYRWTEENEPEKLDALEEFLDVRANAQISKDAKEYWGDPNRKDGMNNIVGNTVLGLVGRLSGVMHTADLALQSIAVAGGARNEIDYGRMNAASVGGEAAVSAQTQKLAEIGSLSDWIKGLEGTWLGDKNLGDLYRAGVDSAASILNGALFGAGTGLATGTQVYSSAYTDAKERGATDGQAGLFAAFQAAAEGAGEQVSFGSFQNLIVARGLDKKIGGKILLGLFQSAEEAGQEYVTEGMNVLADNLIMQELSEEEKSRQELMAYGYDPTTAAEMAREESNERMLDAALGGFIGGALRSGSSYAGQGIDAGMTAIGDYATGSVIQKNNNAGMMAQLMSEVSGQEVAPETSKRKLGKQQREFLNKAGEYLAGADDAVRDFVYGKISNIAQASQKPLEGTSQATKEKAGKRLASMQQDENGASVGGESVTVQGFVKTAGKDGDARLNIKKADGTLAEADIADVTFDSKTAEVYSYAADMATPELANNFRMSIEPAQAASIEQVANGYSQAYDMAKAGFKEASIRGSNLTSALTDAQVSTVYKLGAEARRTAQLETIATAKQRAEANLGNKWKGGKATFDESVVVDALDNEQKSQIDMASAVTGAMGVNVVFFESKADETGRYTRENGSYNRRTNTIYIDVNAGRYYKGDSPSKTALLRTLSHEVTHAVQRNSPEIYAELRDTVTDILGDAKGVTIEDLIDRKMAADSSLTTRDAAIDELVADACEKMLEDSDAAQRLMEAHPEAAKTFFQKVGELLNRIAEAIRAAFKGRKLSTEAQLVMKDVERYQKMVDLWTKGVMQTAEVSGKEQGEMADSETENAAISEETAAEGENITSGEVVGEYGEPARTAETHIDNRTWESVGDRGVKAFQNEYKYTRVYMGPAAKALLEDAKVSLPGARYQTMDGEWGGQTRWTTDVLAELKDRGGWSWDQLKSALGTITDMFDAGDLETDLPDTAIVKRIEIILDEILTEGYDAMEGAHIVPNAGYVAYKNELPGAAGQGSVQQEEGLTFEEYTQFQMRRPVERAKGLVAVHNLTEEKLVAAMKLGGFPMPSIAIAKTSIGHQNFGPISLVFGSDTIDPKANRKNKVYSADAWTPTFPRIEYQVNDAAERRVNSKLADLRRRIDPFFERDLQRLLYGTEDLLNRYDGEEGLIKHVLDNYGMKAAYLEDTGRHADAVTRTEERIREVNPLRGEIYTAIAELVGLEGLRSRSLGEIRDMYGAQLEEIYPGSTKSAMRLSRILSNVIEYFENKDSAPETVTVTDAAATNRAVDEAVDIAAYEQWVRELYDGIEAASGVYNGKDIYTSSGNRRSFASTHYPVSVENIAKAMYDAYGGKMKNVSAHYDAKTMRAVTARTFRSIDEMHKYEGRMRARTQEEADALTNDLNSRLNTLVSRIQTEKNAGRKLDLYEEMTQADQIGAILQEIAVKKFDPASLQNGLAAYGYQIGEQTAAELSKLITEISEMPVNIFEAKPERAVYFDEVRYAIVPDDMNADVRRQLEQLVPDVREYTEGDEARRLELLNEREDVQFQTRNGVEFIEHKYFARLIDNIETQKPGGYLRVGAIQSGSVLAKVGLPENDLYFDVDKINRALDDHDDHITKEILKQVPVILRQPIAIAEARQENTVNVFGDVWISNSPVMVGIVVTKDRSGRNVINKVRTVHARHNYMARITDESVLYLNEDKKRTREWFQARGNDVPLGGTKFGFIRRIALSEDVVNPDIQKQTRNPDQISVRELLLNLQESNDSEESAWLAGYKADLGKLMEKQAELDVQRQELERLNRNARQSRQDAKQRSIEYGARSGLGKTELALLSRYENTIETFEQMPKLNEAQQSTLDKARANFDHLKAKAVEGLKDGEFEEWRRQKKLSEGEIEQLLSDSAREELLKVRNRVAVLSGQLARMDEGLLKQEASKPIMNIVEREREKAKKKADKRVERLRNRYATDTIRKRLSRKAATLDERLRHPKDGAFIPDEFKQAAIELDKLIAVMNVGYGGDAGKKAGRRIDRIQRELAAMKAQGTSIAQAVDEDLVEELAETEILSKDKLISEMTIDDLQLIEKTIDHMLYLSNNAYNVLIDGKNERVEEAAAVQAEEMEGKRTKKREGLLALIKQMARDESTPIYFFRRLGGKFQELAQGLFDGESDYGILANEAGELIKDIKKRHNYSQWYRDGILEIVPEFGGRLKLNREEALMLYATHKREITNTRQDARHLEQGGVVEKHTDPRIKGAVLSEKGIRLTETDMQKISNWLTTEQKAYADEVVAYLSGELAEKLNEASRRMHGYSKFTERYYFPYRVSKASLPQNIAEAEAKLIASVGMSKSTVANASKPVMLGEFTDMVTEHITTALLYTTIAPAQQDFMRLLNYRFEEGAHAGNTMTELVTDAYGQDVMKYMLTFMADIWGTTAKKGSLEALADRMTSRFKKNAVVMSASVWLQQYTSLYRAWAVMGQRYFYGKIHNPKGSWEEAKRYSGTAVLKDIGRFDTNVGRNVAEWIADKKDYRWLGRLGDKTDSFMGWIPEKMDMLAWTRIWEACKREQASKLGLDIGSEEVKRAAGRRMDEVTRLTQVYDSVFSKSAMMRSKNPISKTFTNFMAEATITVNMLMDAWMNIKTDPAQFARTNAVLLLSTVMVNLFASLAYAWRDKDEDETYLEKYAQSLVSGFVDDLNFMNYLPFLNQVASEMRGFSSERTEMAPIADTMGYAKLALKIDSNDTIWQRLGNAGRAFGSATGYPIKNILREYEGIKRTIQNAGKVELREGALLNAVKYGAAEGSLIATMLGIEDSKNYNADQMYEAILDGDIAGAEELREHLKVYNGADDDKAVDSLLRARIKEGFIAGEIDEDEALEMLTEHGGKRSNEAEDLISEWSYTRDNDGRKYDDMKDAFLAGEISAEEAIDARVKYGGAEEENSEKTVQTWQYQKDTGYVYDDMRDDVLDGEISAADAIAYRVKYGGVKQETAEATVGKWEYERKYGYAYEDLREEHVAGNITSSEAIRAMTEYGGKDANDAYWEVTEWDYTNDGGEWDGKGTLLNDAFAGGNAAKVRSSMKQLLEHSNWKKPGNELASYVTDYYKPMFEAAGTEKQRQLQPVILDYIQMAYEAAGEEYFGDKYTLRYRSWLKIK